MTDGPTQFERAAPGGNVLRGESAGEGPAIVQLHGLTATRRYVVHGSRALERDGFTSASYDARGHGESDPAPEGEGYGYEHLASDLEAVLDGVVPGRRAVLAGHSMGAHTLANFALAQPDRIAGVVFLSPASVGGPKGGEDLERWDALADGLERGGVEGFLEAYDDGSIDPQWYDTIMRITRDRLGLHRHPEALVRALREVPRSAPFPDLSALETVDVPALVIASRDEADPGHPYAVGEAWAERLPQARFLSEEPGESPLAWQGGKLSREIAGFAREPAVEVRLGG